MGMTWICDTHAQIDWGQTLKHCFLDLMHRTIHFITFMCRSIACWKVTVTLIIFMHSFQEQRVTFYTQNRILVKVGQNWSNLAKKGFWSQCLKWLILKGFVISHLTNFLSQLVSLTHLRDFFLPLANWLIRKNVENSVSPQKDIFLNILLLIIMIM